MPMVFFDVTLQPPPGHEDMLTKLALVLDVQVARFNVATDISSILRMVAARVAPTRPGGIPHQIAVHQTGHVLAV